MDIKIGFTDNPRELVIASDGDHNTIVAEVTQAIEEGRKVVDLSDTLGHRYLVRTDTIAYVEVGSSSKRAVGFIAN